MHELNGEIFGQGNDIEGYGLTSDRFRIQGFIEDDFISFIKQYQKHQIIHPGGKTETIYDLPPPEITYTGLFNNNNNQFGGDWDIILESRQWEMIGWIMYVQEHGQ